MDDVGLVRAAAAGDRSAFADIYDRYADRVHAFATSVLRDPDEAADVTQDTFMVAARRLDQLRDPARLRPWLFAIARHEAFRRAKKRSRQVVTDEFDDVPSTERSAEDVVSGQDAATIVHAAAAGLTERDRAVLDLSLRHGLEGEELGAAMGISPGHASVLAGRVRDRVEKSLGALLVARLGRDDCTELQGVLGDWDGSFSPLVRKRVARHVEGCATCSATKRRVASPAALLSAAPIAVAPASLRTRVLDAFDAQVAAGPSASAEGIGGEGTASDLPASEGPATPEGSSSSVGSDGTAPSAGDAVDPGPTSAGADGAEESAAGGPDGIEVAPPETEAGSTPPPSAAMAAPPPIPTIHLDRDGFPRSGSRLRPAVAVGLVVVLLLGAVGLGVALTGDDDEVQTLATGAEAADDGRIDAERNLSVAGEDEADEADEAGSPVEVVVPEQTTSTTGSSSGSQSSGGGGGGGAPPPPPPPPDTTGPAMSISANPAVIYSTNADGCPMQSTVTATASDPSGIASWSSSPAGSGGGGSWSVVVTNVSFPAPSVSVSITAVDGVGNSTTRTIQVPIQAFAGTC